MEIERKYLINQELWQEQRNPANATFLQQAYLSIDQSCSVRIRLTEKEAFITIKGRTTGISREEYEYTIPFSDGVRIIKMAVTPIIEKLRYKVHFEGYLWEVDEFWGDNEGLVLAEVELPDEIRQPVLPQWVEKEVSGDPRYYNLALAINPINTWK
jgi:CYTH domain-containing protein